MGYSRRKWGSQRKQRKTYKNDEIRAFNVQVIGSEGESMWMYTRNKAIEMAYEQWMDLVQIKYDPVEKVCTAKIMDFGKYMYEKKRQESDKKKGAKKWQKEVKFWYNIWDHDLLMKVGRAKEFLSAWYTVRVVVMLKWREKAYREIVRTKLDFVTKELELLWRPQSVKQENFWFSLMVFPVKK